MDNEVIMDEQDCLENKHNSNSLKLWLKEHKNEIIISGLSIASVAIMAILFKNKESKRDLNEKLLKEELEYYLNKSNNLEKENIRLKDLCEIKDSFFNEIISDALRHGSSLAGKHMSDRKQYLITNSL